MKSGFRLAVYGILSHKLRVVEQHPYLVTGVEVEEKIRDKVAAESEGLAQ